MNAYEAMCAIRAMRTVPLKEVLELLLGVHWSSLICWGKIRGWLHPLWQPWPLERWVGIDPKVSVNQRVSSEAV